MAAVLLAFGVVGEMRKAILAISALAFGLLSMVAGTGLMQGTDVRLTDLAQARSSAPADTLGSLLSVPGRAAVSTAGLVVLALVMTVRGRGRLGRRLLISLLLATLVEITLKFTLPQEPIPEEVQRLPDPSILDFETPYPYPSGHMLRTVILLGAVYVLYPNRAVRTVIPIILAGAAVTRVYLGTH